MCGWHENLVAAAAVVSGTAGTIVRDTDSLPERLRRFADRAARCWEGTDADDAIGAMLEAADLLDNAELSDLLKRAADSPTVRKNRRADLSDNSPRDSLHSDGCSCYNCKSLNKLFDDVDDLLGGDR